MQDRIFVSCRLDGLYAELSSQLHAGRYQQSSDRLQIPEASVNWEAAQAIRCICQHFRVNADLIDDGDLFYDGKST